jgi:hypothetical protein
MLQLVLQAPTSLRAASMCLEIFKPWLGLEHVPVPNTGENWLLRVGLYELRRPKEHADDWAWLIDCSIQIGPHKVLLIAGVRLSHWIQARRPLELSDLSILAIQPMLTTVGEAIRDECQAVAALCGAPRMIACDGGGDLNRGITLFQEDHPQTARVGDIAHKAALLVKHHLGSDSRWDGFLHQLGRSTQHAKHTPVACLVAPPPRLKARYMNLYEQVGWGLRLLRFLDSPQRLQRARLDPSQVEAKFGWVRDYRPALGEWDEVIGVVGTTLEYIRVEGYSQQAAPQLRARLGAVETPQARQVANDLVDYVAEQSRSVAGNERLIGSTEVVESLFGKLKRLEGQQNKNGFTKLLLGAAASVATLSKERLHAAFNAIKTKDIAEWCEQHLGISLQAQRQRALGCTPSGCIAGTKTG